MCNINEDLVIIVNFPSHNNILTHVMTIIFITARQFYISFIVNQSNDRCGDYNY